MLYRFLIFILIISFIDVNAMLEHHNIQFKYSSITDYEKDCFGHPYANPHTYLKVEACAINDSVVGHVTACLGCPGNYRGPGILHIHELYVNQAHRKCGMGRLLLRELCSRAKQKQCKKISFDSEINAEAFVFINRLRQQFNFTLDPYESNKKKWKIMYEVSD